MSGPLQFVYILCAFLFILGLKLLSSPASARRGNQLSSLGMLLAVVVTLIGNELLSFQWIVVGILAGGVVGALAARRVAMTSMPELVALFNGFGGLASLLVAWFEYRRNPDLITFTAATVFVSVLIGGVTFTGSLVARGKLSERISGKPLLFPGQHLVNILALAALLAGGVMFALAPASNETVFYGILGLTALLGVLLVIPIGGADMPVVISLLNSYSGLAACATGFVIQNTVLIVTGSLVGASGVILTRIMCKAMNRSLANVLFSGFGSAASAGSGGTETREAKSVSAGDAFVMLEAARSVVFVPGYGLAVAQAQHAARELGDLLEQNGAEVRYGIHPVAGRMPGHMNVLLAEANVPYDQLAEMDAVNPTMDTVDVCVVIGANDVVNPAALTDEKSPIYGMPIIEAHRARTVIIMKRSLGVGFAGIGNDLFYKENARMLFGDAKASLQALVAEFKEG
jgi:NAD(P) transhydrogenase subunit beta